MHLSDRFPVLIISGNEKTNFLRFSQTNWTRVIGKRNVTMKCRPRGIRVFVFSIFFISLPSCIFRRLSIGRLRLVHRWNKGALGCAATNTCLSSSDVTDRRIQWQHYPLVLDVDFTCAHKCHRANTTSLRTPSAQCVHHFLESRRL